MYVLQGDQDTAVPVEHSRAWRELLQRLGYDVRYREIPGRGHEDLKARDEIAAWLLEHRAEGSAREVRLRCLRSRGRARVLGARHALGESVRDDRSARDAGARRHPATRYEERRQPPTEPPAAAAPTRRPRDVIWNGRRSRPQNPTGGVYLLAPGAKPAPLDKNVSREGRLTYFFNTPFAIVIGTSSKDPAMTRAIDHKAATSSICGSAGST